MRLGQNWGIGMLRIKKRIYITYTYAYPTVCFGSKRSQVQILSPRPLSTRNYYIITNVVHLIFRPKTAQECNKKHLKARPVTAKLGHQIGAPFLAPFAYFLISQFKAKKLAYHIHLTKFVRFKICTMFSHLNKSNRQRPSQCFKKVFVSN